MIRRFCFFCGRFFRLFWDTSAVRSSSAGGNSVKQHLWKTVLVLAFVACSFAASAKADVVVADNLGHSCVFGVRANDVIRVQCVTIGSVGGAFVRECKVVPGSDGCSSQFADIVWRVFITLGGQPEAVIADNLGAQRLNL
jgi:hypothetical protein